MPQDPLSALIEAARKTGVELPREASRAPSAGIMLGELPESMRGPLALSYEYLRTPATSKLGAALGQFLVQLIVLHFAQKLAALPPWHRKEHTGIVVGPGWHVYAVKPAPYAPPIH